MLSENMASLGGEQIISTKDLQDSTPQKTTNSRPSSVERKLASRDRDEKLRLIKERQNEERQRKIEELKAQAEAAQKYREQKEEERKRRIDELRNRENDKRHQVEERKKALMEAEREKREFILRRNMERENKLENKRRNERSSVYAFGSSTPRLLDPVELGTLSQSTYWGHRRSTSITNVAYTGAPLSRRSSERELADGSKKRATSAGGIDRQTDDRRFKSTSMYEVFNWGYLNDEPPKRLNLSFAATEINIDGPTKYTNIRNNTKEDITDSPPISYRSVARRKTDLMPTIPSPRESSFGSKTSLHSHTPRTPGRAVSMTRLDQLAQPIRRNGEHIRAVIERERQQQYGLLSNTSPNTLTQTSPTSANAPKSMSRSMTHLAGSKQVYSNKHINDNNSINGDQHVRMRPLKKNDTSRSMTQLTTANRIITTTTATKKFTTARSARYERKEDAPSSLASTGSRSGDVTPGGSINTSRPGSAMSTSTTASGLVQRRSVGTVRKPRPASIAVTGVSLTDDFNKYKKEKPPLPKQQSTPKRITNNSNAMTKSMSVDTPKSIEKRASAKKDVPTPKPRAILQQTTDNNEKSITESVTVTQTTVETKITEKEIVADIPQTKEEKEALNAVKTEAGNASENVEIVTEIKTEVTEEIEITPTEEKADTDTEKEKEKEKEPSPKLINELRELSAERQDNEMTASMIARKITTEEQAKAALAEKRRLMREEAERQAELERQRVEAERLAELKRQAEEEEKQRKFEEETLRLAEEQKKAEEQRLLQAIEEAKKREEAERLKREEEEKQRIEREEAERKAKEEAEKQRLEIAERLKKEEKEREERRKRVEAIMSRTRAKGGNATPNSTPTKENDTNKVNGKDEKLEETVEKSTNEQSTANIESNRTAQSDSTANIQQKIEQPAAEVTAAQVDSQQQQVQLQQPVNESIQQVQQPQEQPQQMQFVQETQQQQLQTTEQQLTTQPQPFSEQVAYEKTVTDRENALIQSFSNMIIDDVKAFPNFQNPFVSPSMINGKTLQEQNQSNESVVQSIANGNGHIENISKNDTNQLVDFTTNQLIDFNNESQQVTGNVNFNNNSLSSTMGPNLVTSDSHENKEISLL